MSSTIETLKQLIQLEEKRAGLQQQLATLDSQLNALKAGLTGGGVVKPQVVVKAKGKPGRKPGSKNVVKPVAAPIAAPKAPAKPAGALKPKGKKGKGFQRGALAENIKAALKEAGAKGINIKELSAKLKSEYRNIQVWFATTGKKHKDIKKIAPATYALK